MGVCSNPWVVDNFSLTFVAASWHVVCMTTQSQRFMELPRWKRLALMAAAAVAFVVLHDMWFELLMVFA